MLKKTVSIFVVLVIAGFAFATWEEIPYDWVEINSIGTNANITLDDQNVGPFDIGFAFPWYDGVTHNQIRICSNGFASFTSTATSYTNYAIPTASEPNNLLAVYWDDMNPSSSYYGQYYYYHDAANGRFIVEFDSLNHYGSTYTGDYFTFEIILYEDGTIEYMYKAIVAGTVTPFPSATVGIENGTGTDGIQLTYNGSGPFEPTNLTGVRLTPWGAPLAIDVTMTPISPPIQIPANGGSFDFDLMVTNNEPGTNSYDIWTSATLPNGSEYGPIIQFNITNSLGFSATRTRTQNVPATAPSGNYTYNFFAGDYPDLVYDSDTFPFEKLAAGDGGALVNDWNIWGESFEDLLGEALTPDEFALNNAYPNPFNPTATISYTLAEATNVKLTVFDISGREVAVLADGWMNSGIHQAVFDAKNLASGVYFYTIKAGSFTDTKKMILMK